VNGSIDPLDAAASQAWLAALAYDLLCGHPVSPSQSATSLPKPIRAHRAEVPEAAEAVVFRALAADPERRFPSVAELAAAFRRATTVPYGEPEEERTTVSSVPSGIAEQLRRGVVALPDDEQTVVSPPDHRFDSPAKTAARFTPTQQVAHPAVVERPARSLWIGAAVAVLAAGALVVWRVAASRPPTTATAPPPVAAAAPAVASAPGVPAVARLPAAPAAAPVVAEMAAPAEPESAVHEASPGAPDRPLHARAHARSVDAVKEPVIEAAPDGPKNCRLSVASYPWADMWVDGADPGLHTPVVGFAISCGRHRLEFKRGDLNVDQVESITLSEGNEFKRQYELKGAELDD
jgi:hypothetical protein